MTAQLDAYYRLMVTSTFVLSDPLFTGGFDRVRNVTTGDRLRDRQVAHAEAMTDVLISEIRRRPKDKRLFLWTHYVDPHDHYLPHDGAPVTGDDPFSRYKQEVWFVDHHLGRLFAALDEEGLWENSVVFLFGDHGEAFMEHGYDKHERTLYDEMIAVPLLARVPGKKGRTFDFNVSLLDLYPTVMDLAGRPVSGRSLGRSLVKGEPLPDVGVISILDDPPIERLGAVMKGPWKMIIHRDTFCRELYNRSEDPGETRNLIDAQPAWEHVLMSEFLFQLGDAWRR